MPVICMNKVLEKVVVKKREDIFKKKKLLSIQELGGQTKKRRNELFYRAIIQAAHDPAIIAEVKFASPQGGIMGLEKDLLGRVKQYESAGVDVISIITEPHFFKGNIDFIGKVKEAVKLPVLQKDFVIDEYQIYEASREGADALLLISRLVDEKTLEQFVESCLAEGTEPVVEIYSEEDLGKAIATETRFIAVNSRDLDTFEVNVERACRFMKKIPEKFVRLGFSGIQSEDEVRKYREAGARGVLVGTALMRTRNVGEFLQGLEVTRGSSKCKDQISKSS